MKKFFYVLLLSVVTSLAVSSCTEEPVEPRADEASNGGGRPIEKP